MAAPKLKRGSWLVTSALVLGASGYLFFGFMPAMKSLTENRRKTTERREYVASADRLKPAVDAATQELEQAKAFNKRAGARLSDDRRLAELYQQINTQAKFAGVTTKRFEPQKRTSNLETLRQSGLLLEAVGTFDQINRMLASFEALPAMIAFESVKIAPQREEGTKNVCELKMAVFLGSSEKND